MGAIEEAFTTRMQTVVRNAREQGIEVLDTGLRQAVRSFELKPGESDEDASQRLLLKVVELLQE